MCKQCQNCLSLFQCIIISTAKKSKVIFAETRFGDILRFLTRLGKLLSEEEIIYYKIYKRLINLNEQFKYNSMKT